MTIKVTIPNTSSDSLTFGSGNTPTAAQVVGIDSGSSNGQLAFNTTASGTSTERMRIDASGNVGVGTTTPSGQFHVRTDAYRQFYVTYPATYETRLSIGSANNYINATADTEYLGLSATYTTGNIRFSTGASNTERARIDSSGNLLVGVSSTSVTNGGVVVSPLIGSGSYIDIGHPTAAGNAYGYIRFFWNGSVIGQIAQNGTTGVTYNTSSDYRLKENIAPMTGALSVVQQLKPVTYKWKVDGSDGQGFIAHELQAIVPDCVTGEKDAVDADGNPVYQGIDTSFLVATLTAAIQEQQAQISSQAAVITTLTERISALEAK